MEEHRKGDSARAIPERDGSERPVEPVDRSDRSVLAEGLRSANPVGCVHSQITTHAGIADITQIEPYPSNGFACTSLSLVLTDGQVFPVFSGKSGADNSLGRPASPSTIPAMSSRQCS